ncbi:MAG: SAM-dependent methyltransferase, partial [Alistipes sp.]|nr:SAM-dependent methyltransferase [Alistipes sp.]
MCAGKIYMLPTPIGDTPVYDVLPLYNQKILQQLEYFVVEDLRSARRFLSRAGINRPIDSLRFGELNEHSTPEEVATLLEPILQGSDAGVISEAGMPGIADPGAELTALAHLRGIEVVPLVGPSSILLALMASGLNGQSFAFNGYLPIKSAERTQALRFFERRAQNERQSQLFIEAPYRNLKLYEEMLRT